jgi:predicted dehydrogenase
MDAMLVEKPIAATMDEAPLIETAERRERVHCGTHRAIQSRHYRAQRRLTLASWSRISDPRLSL